jgi:hypothetical protein
MNTGAPSGAVGPRKYRHASRRKPPRRAIDVARLRPVVRASAADKDGLQALTWGSEVERAKGIEPS